MKMETLRRAVSSDSAFRRRQRLQPAGGAGDKIFPPTYPGEGRTASPQHVFEVRRIHHSDKTQENLVCVLIDSVQSQANRLEEALENAAETGAIEIPRLIVDFPGAGVESVGMISDLRAPHRIFDAILRDSEYDGTPFRESDKGKALRTATAADATAILEISPASLLFGVWNSTGEGGGLGAKFARAITSEIIGVNVPIEEGIDRRTGEITLTSGAKRTGSRIDPLGIRSSVEVHKGANGWAFTKKDAGKGAKQLKPSEINHGNLRPSVESLGVTCDYAEQTTVVSLAGLRRLRFGESAEKNEAARMYIAALGLVAICEGDSFGYALRSRCDLVCDGIAPLQIVHFDGTTEDIELSLDTARSLYSEALVAARAAGFSLETDALILKPQEKLAELVRQSQAKAMSDESESDQD